MQNSTETAVIVFAESVKQQTQKKSFFKDADSNYKLLSRLTKMSLKVANDSGLDVFHVDETLQKGATFADRIANSIQAIFDKGYTKVIAIGSDCPDLKARDLAHINTQLEEKDIVLGPDLRGGIYAMGLTKQSFDYQAFKQLYWQSGRLRKSFAQYAKGLAKSILWLKAKSDFNTKEDILRYWHLSSHIRSIVEHFIRPIQNLILLSESITLRLLIPVVGKRGP